MTDEALISLKVGEAAPKDAGRSLARLDPKDLERLGAKVGDVLLLEGKRKAAAKAMPAFKEDRGHDRIQIDGTIRANVEAAIGERVSVQRVSAPAAKKVVLTPLDTVFKSADARYLASLLDGIPVIAGDRVRAALFGSRKAAFLVAETAPQGVVVIQPTTLLSFADKRASGAASHAPSHSYEDIGGLEREVARIRELVELPLRYPEVFERLGIEPPKGVLLHGAPGTGKTLIARTVAAETDAAFFSIAGPEIVTKFYGESEANLRRVFDEARSKAPSIIFIDEIDAIAPRREHVTGEVEKRIVAQLLSLMDGLGGRGQVVVIGATNIPNALDPALRRPGRFDREIEIPIPDRRSRLAILEVHSRGMPLAEDVGLAALADTTHGFVGADLEALCREAAMTCLRDLLPSLDLQGAEAPYEKLLGLQVRMAHFEEALQGIEPTAIREVFVEVPKVPLSDVGGLGDVKRRLFQSIEGPLRHAEHFRRAGLRPPRGVLLVGPPGTGKTLLAKALATESQANFIAVKGPALLSKYVGESERAVRDVFRKARQAAPTIVFLDEVDALARRRSAGEGDSGVQDRVLAQILTEMDGIEALRGVLVLGATNRLDILDPALVRPGRFDQVIRVPPPDLAGRREILEIHARGKPLGEDADLGEIARTTDGWNGAELEALLGRAALLAVEEVLAGEKGPESIVITRALLERARREVADERGPR